MKNYKKVLLSFLILGALALPSQAMTVQEAEDLESPAQSNVLQNIKDLKVNLGPITLNMPFTSVNVVYLFDFVEDKNLLGGETIIAKMGSVSGTFGAVSNMDGEGTPFIGFDTIIPEKFFGGRLRFGAFVGYNFNKGEAQAGIKASVKLW